MTFKAMKLTGRRSEVCSRRGRRPAGPRLPRGRPPEHAWYVHGGRQLIANPLGRVSGDMSGDDYRPGQDRSLMVYPCGVRAGDRLRLKQDLHSVDHRDQRTGEMFQAGSLWTVVPGVESEPDVVWLHQPDQFPHTWDGSVLDAFDLVASAPPVGSLATLSRVPEWVASMPPESQRLFSLCVGRPLPVEEIDANGLVVLNASVFDAHVGDSYNDIRVEADLVEQQS